jgi:hypothetical protein
MTLAPIQETAGFKVIPLGIIELGYLGKLPSWFNTVDMIPAHDLATPFNDWEALDLDTLLAALWRIRDVDVAAFAVPLPKVPRANKIIALDSSLNAAVRAKMQTVGVLQIYFAGLAPPQHEILIEVLQCLDLAGL